MVEPSSTKVSTRTPGPSGGRKRVITPGAGAKSRVGSSALIRSSITGPARDGPLALAPGGDGAVVAAEPLDPDVPRGRDPLPDEERAVAEGRVRLPGRALEGVVEIARVGDEPHPFPAATRCRFEENGE